MVLESPGLIDCACGCGTQLTSRDSKGRPRRFLRGHYTRTNNPSKPKERVQWRRSHEIAVLRKQSQVTCEWEHIGHCKGPLQVAHVNGDEFDNDLANLKKLCAGHHHLLDNGRIDPLNPAMPAFVVFPNGRRIYEHSAQGSAYYFRSDKRSQHRWMSETISAR